MMVRIEAGQRWRRGTALAHWRFLLIAALRRRRERDRLMALGDRSLKDLGLGRGDAYREYAKRCWRV